MKKTAYGLAVAAAVLSFGLIGCGDEDPPNDPTSTDDKAATTFSAPAPGEESPVSDQPEGWTEPVGGPSVKPPIMLEQ